MFRNRYPFMEEAGAEAGSAPDPSPVAETPPAEPQSPPPSDWRSSLPLELRDSPTIKDVPDLGTLVKNYEHTKAMVGASIRLPTDEASADDIAAIQQKLLEKEHLGLMKKPDVENPESLAEVYRALGRPEDASGYAVPEDVNGELFGSMAETALELGLSNKQYEGLAKTLASQQMAEYQKMEEAKQQEVGQLRGEWGPAFDQKLGRAAQVAEALKAPQSLVEALKDGSANAESIRFMDTVAAQLGKEGGELASQLGTVTESTVSDLQQRIADRTRKMLDKDNPLPPAEHQELIKRNVADHEKLAAYRK